MPTTNFISKQTKITAEWLNEVDDFVFNFNLPVATIIPVANGGTGATTAGGARTNLGVTATGTDTTYNYRANNLSDVANAATARSNLGLVIGSDVQAYDAELAAIAGLTSAADKGIQFTGSGTAATYDLTTAGKALLDDATAADQRTTLGLGTLSTQSGTFSGTSSGTNTGDQNLFGTIAVSGQSDVVADSTSDTLTLVAGSNVTITTDASTDSITIAASGGGGGLSDGDYGDITVSGASTVLTIDNDVVTYAKMQNVSATDKILGRSSVGAGDVEEITCTAAGRALLDDATASAQRTTLGLAIGTDVQAYDAELAAIAGLTSAADKGIQFTGAGTAATYDLTTAGKALLDDANAAAQRTTLGLGTIATQDSSNVSITGGSVTGITDITVADGGTGVSTMTTAYAPVCAGTTATGALQVASTGLSTSGYVLTSNGASALPSFQAPASSGALTLLLESTASASSSIVFSSTYITTTYAKYMIILQAIVLATDAQAVVMEVSSDNGSTWETTGYDMSTHGVVGGTGVLGTSTTNFIIGHTSTYQGNNTNEDCNATLWLYGAAQSVTTKLTGTVAIASTATAQYQGNIGGAYEATTALNAIRFRSTSGNLTSGVISLYGVS